MRSSLPPEFALVAACCRWPASERRNEAIRKAASANIDWQRFLRVVARQRVAPLVSNALHGLGVAPPDVVEALVGIASQNVRQSIFYAAEASRLQALFDEAAIPVVFLKGATLAMLAYGTLAVKHGRDIDLLVPPDSIRRGISLLQEAGYRPHYPIPAAPSLFRKWVATAKDFEFFDPVRGVVLELHWSLTENAFHATQLVEHLCDRTVQVSENVQLRTLSDEVLFLYLCMHGARHGWFRLKWLADVAAFLAQLGEENLDRYIASAERWRMEPCVAQTILLCDMLFEADVVAAAAARFRKNARYRWLERVALKMMTRRNAEVESRTMAFGNFPVLVSHFLLGRGWRYFWAESRLKLTNLQDMARFPLPRALWFLYPILRLPLFVMRRLKDRGIGMG